MTLRRPAIVGESAGNYLRTVRPLSDPTIRSNILVPSSYQDDELDDRESVVVKAYCLNRLKSPNVQGMAFSYVVTAIQKVQIQARPQTTHARSALSRQWRMALLCRQLSLLVLGVTVSYQLDQVAIGVTHVQTGPWTQGA
jgi:hypothetical protein